MWSTATVVFKSDQEPALGDLLQEVVKRRGDARTFVEQSPVASSASNGVIERRNLSVEGQVRVLKDAFEARLGKKVPSDHAALAWLVEFAAVLVKRFEVGYDGKTPYERSGGSRRSCWGSSSVSGCISGGAGRQGGWRSSTSAGRTGYSWRPVVERRGCRGDRGWRAEDEDGA